MVRLKVRKLDEKAVVPRYARPGDAGMDVVAVSKKIGEKFIEYGIGLSFEVPDGYVMLIFPRSSVSKTDLTMANCVGVLDSGYRGELLIRFRSSGDETYCVGDRVAQIVVLPIPSVEIEETESLTETSRGDGGFGSTGK